MLWEAWERGQVVPILAYHAVDGDPLDYSISPATFRNQIQWLAESAEILSLVELEDVLSGRRAVRRPVVVTFDDGYESVYEAAFPLFRELQIPFAVFLSTKYVGGEFPLQGRRKQMLSWSQISEMLDSGLLWHGSHTHSHRILMDCTPEEIIEEVEVSRDQMRRNTGMEPRYFAFPKSKSDDVSRDLVRRYFTLVFVREGLQHIKGADSGTLQRVGIGNQMSLRSLRWSFSPLYWGARSLKRRLMS